MGRPSSDTATMPAPFIAAISASASPLLPADAAPMGQTRTPEASAARSRIARVTEALSFTGRVLGIGHTAVNPPRAAARVPVSIVSEDSPPGSRRWQCKSMNPGATTMFAASKISAPLARPASCPGGATAAMRPPSSKTSRGASVPLAGSSTRPFLISSMRGILCWRSVPAANQQKQQRHADGQPIGHLLEHARLRAVGHRGINFQATNHGSGMKHERIRTRAAQPLRRQLVLQDVLVERQGRLVQAFLLHAQGNNDFCALESLLDAGYAANRSASGAQTFQLPRQPHRRPAEREPAAELRQQVNVGARHAAVQDVAENRDVQPLDGAAPIPNRQSIQERLRGMLMRAISRVDNGNRQMPRA